MADRRGGLLIEVENEQVTDGSAAKTHNALDKAEPTLPIHWYYDPDQYQRELEGVFYSSWLYLCRAEALAEPKSYQSMSVGNQHLFVVRSESGKLAGYYNVCRHRGAMLINDESGCLTGDSVACPYHRWRYALEDGSLLRVSSFREPDGFDSGDYGLFPVAVREWRGFVFVHLDPAAEWDVDAVFNGEQTLLDNFSIEQHVLGQRWVKTIECNWKTFWDNYSECLHCPGVHPELIKVQPIYKRGLLVEDDHPDWHEHRDNPDPSHRGGLAIGAETWSTDHSAQGYADHSGLSEQDIARGVTYATAYPGMYIAGFADHTRTVRILPLGPERVEMTVEWLVQPAALADPDYKIENIVEFVQQVLLEDGEVCELTQRGMHARPMRRGVLMPEEYEVKAFKDWLLMRLEKTS
ncbi:MAG: aromatic ring-hydroxylating dioxygenase subunit alpha [Pseudomonadota bacterium]